MKKNEFIRGKPVDVGGEQRLSFVFKLITFVIIIIGLQASAQSFAHSVGYEPGWVGYPSYIVRVLSIEIPIYPFWNLFTWTLMNFRVVQIHSLLFSAWQISIRNRCPRLFFFCFFKNH